MIEIKKNALAIIRIQRTKYKGHDLIDIRVYVEDRNGEKIPTKKGITFKVELLDEIIEALKEIKGEATP